MSQYGIDLLFSAGTIHWDGEYVPMKDMNRLRADTVSALNSIHPDDDENLTRGAQHMALEANAIENDVDMYQGVMDTFDEIFASLILDS
jgi:hypothetical protein